MAMVTMRMLPELSSEWKDTDGDRVGDNSDKFPMNPDEWKDSDLDGVGDNSDYRPYDGEIQTQEDLESFPFFPVILCRSVCLGGTICATDKTRKKQQKATGEAYGDKPTLMTTKRITKRNTKITTTKKSDRSAPLNYGGPTAIRTRVSSSGG